MNNEKNNENKFNEYMEWFKNLNIEKKKEEVCKQSKILAVMSNEMSKSIGLNDKVLVNNELIDIYKSDDDYLEALIVLLSSTQNSLAQYNNGIVDILEKYTEKRTYER